MRETHARCVRLGRYVSVSVTISVSRYPYLSYPYPQKLRVSANIYTRIHTYPCTSGYGIMIYNYKPNYVEWHLGSSVNIRQWFTPSGKGPRPLLGTNRRTGRTPVTSVFPTTTKLTDKYDKSHVRNSWKPRLFTPLCGIIIYASSSHFRKFCFEFNEK